VRVNSFTANDQSQPAVDRAAGGAFLVTWSSNGQDGSGMGVFGQRFASTGSAIGAEFAVNAYVTGDQYDPAAAIGEDGDFTVVWTSQDGSANGVFGRRFDSGGTPLEIAPVNLTTSEDQSKAAIAADADGDFVITWRSDAQDGFDWGVFARSFDAAGLPQTLEAPINTYITASQLDPAIAAEADGDFVIVWQSLQDGDDLGVFAQRFDVAPIIDVDGDGAYLPLTDGLLMLRFGFGFTGSTLISGAVAGGCTRCDAASITAHLQGLL
jgi:hypothetical protein